MVIYRKSYSRYFSHCFPRNFSLIHQKTAHCFLLYDGYLLKLIHALINILRDKCIEVKGKMGSTRRLGGMCCCRSSWQRLGARPGHWPTGLHPLTPPTYFPPSQNFALTPLPLRRSLFCPIIINYTFIGLNSPQDSMRYTRLNDKMHSLQL